MFEEPNQSARQLLRSYQNRNRGNMSADSRNRILRTTKTFAVLVAAVTLSSTAFAQVSATPSSPLESVTSFRASTKDMYGKTGSAELVTTLFKPTCTLATPACPGPFPVVIINHGRGETAAQRSVLTRMRFGTPSGVFVRAGYVVIVPLRIGYGKNSEFDPEATDCVNPNYKASFDAAADQIADAVKYAKTLPDVDPNRIFLVGHSVGGGSVVAAGSRSLEGVRAVVNFAGGNGGYANRPGEPCRADRLESTFKGYGEARSKTPQLWVYPENDEYFSVKNIRNWHEAFVKAGGNAELMLTPPSGVKGHGQFNNAPAEWQTQVLEFFAKNGSTAK